MDIITFLISVYCLIDDSLAGQKLRRRGPQPTVSDAEVPSDHSDISIRNQNESGDPWLECQFFVRDKPVHSIVSN